MGSLFRKADYFNICQSRLGCHFFFFCHIGWVTTTGGGEEKKRRCQELPKVHKNTSNRSIHHETIMQYEQQNLLSHFRAQKHL